MCMLLFRIESFGIWVFFFLFSLALAWVATGLVTTLLFLIKWIKKNVRGLTAPGSGFFASCECGLQPGYSTCWLIGALLGVMEKISSFEIVQLELSFPTRSSWLPPPLTLESTWECLVTFFFAQFRVTIGCPWCLVSRDQRHHWACYEMQRTAQMYAARAAVVSRVSKLGCLAFPSFFSFLFPFWLHR